MIYEFGNQGYISYINGIKRQGLGRQKCHVKEGDVVVSTHQYAYNVVPKEDGCLHCSAHEGGGCYFAFTELDCKKNNVILKEDASKSKRGCKSKSKDPSTEIYTWEANDREVCVKGSLGFEKYLEFSQFLEEFEIGDEEMKVIIEFSSGNIKEMHNVIGIFPNSIYGKHLIRINQENEVGTLVKKIDVDRIIAIYEATEQVVYENKNMKGDN